MPICEQFAEYAVRQLLNYGVSVTSRTEGAAPTDLIKSILKTRNGNLRDLHDATKEQHERQRDLYEEKLHDSQANMSVTFFDKPVISSHTWPSEPPIVEADTATREAGQRCNSHRWAPDSVQWYVPCGHMAQQMGLPCSPISCALVFGVLQHRIPDNDRVSRSRDVTFWEGEPTGMINELEDAPKPPLLHPIGQPLQYNLINPQ